ncbi:MAG TPA: hypothetical protein VJT81_01155 [Burkholderiales bacterium]|nr:hypothetical protein [Burkholderiales bacterium]
MTASAQEEYRRKVEAAVQRAYDVLMKHNLRPQKYRVHIASKGLSNSTEPHALSISTADGSVWVTEASFPFRCLEEVDPFGSDAFASIVADRMTELIRKVRNTGRRL